MIAEITSPITEEVTEMTKLRARQGMNRVHQFQFLKGHIGACRCGWAVAKVPMTALRAQRLAAVHGKDRFGPGADGIFRNGVPFQELTEDQALQGWMHHVRNLPEAKKGEEGQRTRVHSCSQVKIRRQKQMTIAA